MIYERSLIKQILVSKIPTSKKLASIPGVSVTKIPINLFECKRREASNDQILRLH